MGNWIDTFIGFLIVSSALLLALGALSCLILYAFKINGKARLLICSLLLIMPVAYPIGSLIPDHHKVLLPSEKLQTMLPATFESGINTYTYDRDRSTGVDASQAAADKPADIPPSSIQPTAPVLDEDTSFTLAWKQIITIAWIFLFIFILMRSFFIFIKIGRLVKYADDVTDPTTLTVLEQCRIETGLRRNPRLLMVDHTLPPMAVGFLRPAVILPKRLFMPEFREGLRFTLLHELKHIKRRDNWWLLLESLVGSVYFFHPVIFWAKRKIHEEWEHICDRHVVQVTNRPASYADFLLHEIWNHGRRMSPSMAVPLILKERKTTKRVHSILDKMRPTLISKIRDRIAVGTVFVCFLSVFLCTVTPFAKVNDAVSEDGKLQESRHELSLTETGKGPAAPGAPMGSDVAEASVREKSKDANAYSLPEPVKENTPEISPTNEEKPSIDTESLPSVLTENIGIPEDAENSPGAATFFETSNLLAAVDPESLLAQSQTPGNVPAEATPQKPEPERDTAGDAENRQQGQSATGTENEPTSENVSIPMGARIFKWEVIDDRNIIIATRFYGNFKATLAKACPGLSKYKKVSFDSNWPYELDVNSSVILPNDDAYEIQQLVPYGKRFSDFSTSISLKVDLLQINGSLQYRTFDISHEFPELPDSGGIK